MPTMTLSIKPKTDLASALRTVISADLSDPFKLVQNGKTGMLEVSIGSGDWHRVATALKASDFEGTITKKIKDVSSHTNYALVEISKLNEINEALDNKTSYKSFIPEHCGDDCLAYAMVGYKEATPAFTTMIEEMCSAGEALYVHSDDPTTVHIGHKLLSIYGSVLEETLERNKLLY